MPEEPLVLVKKADGTFVRVPFSSIAALPRPAGPGVFPVSAPPVPPRGEAPARAAPLARPALPAGAAEPLLAAGPPRLTRIEAGSPRPATPPPLTRPRPGASEVAPIPAPRQPPGGAPAGKLSLPPRAASGDLVHEQFLTELTTGLSPAPPQATPPSSASGRALNQIISQLSWRVPEQMTNRLQSLIQLRLKDVRTPLQTKLMALRPVAEGGLGLAPAQADELIQRVETHNPHTANRGRTPVVQGDNKDNLTLALEREASSRATPANSEARPQSPAASFTLQSSPVARPRLYDVASPPGAASLDFARGAVLSGAERAAPLDLARDAALSRVERAAPEIGPVEEIRTITLVDWRRLGKTPGEAADRLAQKFKTLAAESTMLALAARSAWHESPLWRELAALPARALREKTTITALAAQEPEPGLQLPEALAILQMEQNLL